MFRAITSYRTIIGSMSAGDSGNPSGATTCQSPNARLFASMKDWRFWAMMATVLPICLAQPFLLWLYLMSFAFVPSGAIVYVALVLHIFAFGWAIRDLFRSKMKNLSLHKQGLTSQPNFTSSVYFMATLFGLATACQAIGIFLMLQDEPSISWSKIANMAPRFFFSHMF